MRFVLEIELGNAEMETCTHIAMALDNVADILRAGGDSLAADIASDNVRGARIRDINGNAVGAWSVRASNYVESRVREVLASEPGKFFNGDLLADAVFGDPFKRKQVQAIAEGMPDVEIALADDHRNYTRYRLARP